MREKGNKLFDKTASKLDTSQYNPYCKVYVKETSDGKEYDIYITDEIVGVDAYTDMLNSLFACDVDDVVHLKINSPGGLLDTGLQIQDAIKSCEGKVIGYLSGAADSAASAIFLACDAYILGDLATMLVHTVSGGSWGAVQDMVDRAMHLQKHNEAWIRATYHNFLTEEEMQDVIVNKRQMHLLSEEIRDRLHIKVEKDHEEFGEVIEDGFEFNLEEMVSDIRQIKDTLTTLQEALNDAASSKRTRSRGKPKD